MPPKENPSKGERNEDSLVTLGHVSGVYGVKGWVRLYSHTEPRTGILDYKDYLLGGEGRWRAVSLSEGRAHGKGIVARFAGIHDRDDAAELIGSSLAVARSDLPEAEEGTFYWVDLEGLEVMREDGSRLGHVAHMLETGANDVMVVRDGKKEVLIPFLKGSVIRRVDLDHGQIHVDWEWD